MANVLVGAIGGLFVGGVGLLARRWAFRRWPEYAPAAWWRPWRGQPTNDDWRLNNLIAAYGSMALGAFLTIYGLLDGLWQMTNGNIWGT